MKKFKLNRLKEQEQEGLQEQEQGIIQTNGEDEPKPPGK